MDLVQCPYCEAESRPDGDVRIPNCEYEHECPKCQSVFKFWFEIKRFYKYKAAQNSKPVELSA